MLTFGGCDLFKELIVGARFLCRLPHFLRYRWTPDEARSTLRRRFEQRESSFLNLVKGTVYANTTNPYRRLLELAHCEYGDLERLVCKDGLEGALQALYRSGVYLTVDELKGRKAVVRSGATFEVSPGDLHNPGAKADLLRHRSESRGVSAPVPVDLTSVRDRLVNLGLCLHARGGFGWHPAVWEVPGGAAMMHVLEWQVLGTQAVRWFSQVDSGAPGLHPRYRWSSRLLQSAGFWSRVSLPNPSHVSIQDPTPIMRWMAEDLRAGLTPHLQTYASAAARVCQVAEAKGIDLHGAEFTVTGEPVTEPRLAQIRRIGGRAVPRCGASEAGAIGYGCLAPEASDELHFYHDLNGLIQPGTNQGLPANSLLLTALRPTARLILINVWLGDQAVVSHRACGCPLEEEGWTTHLHTIRSSEKLTAAGMTFLDVDVIRILEEVLPAKFGGGPTDYQLVEEEIRDGRPGLTLLVHPAVGTIDEAALMRTFLEALGPGSGVERVMSLQWRDAGLLRVQRDAPRMTAGGKILHIHSELASPSASR